MLSISIFGKTISNPRSPMSEAEPVFAAPWEAHAFALAVKLSEAGLFTWSEWSAALAEELAAASRRGEADDGSQYYDRWLAALETLVTVKDLVARPALLARKEEWAEAYRRTPHGRPVVLDSEEIGGSAS
ncbi:MAG: nitrile hydratase accessory protein [Alphaproteobacteria bacterium]|nr:nitrile hydratase accessory protein [Alphaproteobacteria bacterium]